MHATILLIPLLVTAGDRYRAAEVHMGTRFTITLEADDEPLARKAFQAAFDRIEQIDNRLSDYKEDSELNRLSRRSPTNGRVEISEELYHVLSIAEGVSRISDGSFDVTVGPLTRLWRSSRRSGQLPADKQLKQAKAAVGYQQLKLFSENGKYFAELTRKEMQLDLGGIAKGYALDQARREVERVGITSVLIDGGGDLVAGEPPAGANGWRIGIAPLEKNAPPSIVLPVTSQGIATSGDAWQYVEIDGHRYSHIVDPTTGLGLEQRSSVTVIAPTGTMADALASAVSVMGPEDGIKLINGIDNTEALVIVATDDGVKQFKSNGMNKLLDSSGPTRQ